MRHLFLRMWQMSQKFEGAPTRNSKQDVMKRMWMPAEGIVNVTLSAAAAEV